MENKNPNSGLIKKPSRKPFLVGMFLLILIFLLASLFFYNEHQMLSLSLKNIRNNIFRLVSLKNDVYDKNNNPEIDSHDNSSLISSILGEEVSTDKTNANVLGEIIPLLTASSDFISSLQIIDHSIEARDIRTGAVTSRTIKNRTVSSKDLRKTITIGDLTIRDDLTVNDDLIVKNDITAEDNLVVGNDLTVTNNLTVSGLISGSFSGSFAPSGDVDMANHIMTNIGNAGTDFTSGGGLNLAGNFNVSSGDFYVDTASGKVGIGTTDPTEILQVRKDQNAQTVQLVYNNISLGNTSAAALVRVTSFDSSGFIGSFPSDSATTRRQDRFVLATDSLSSGINIEATGASQDIRIFTGGTTERIRINNNGNVGIGTTNPEAKLHVYGGNAIVGSTSSQYMYWDNTYYELRIGNSASTYGFANDGQLIVKQLNDHAKIRAQAVGEGIRSWLVMDRARGTFESPAALQSGDIIGTVVGVGYHGSNWHHGASIDFLTVENWDSTHGGTVINFNSMPKGSATEFKWASLGGDYGALQLFNASSGSRTTGLSLKNNSTSANTGISIDFTPNTNENYPFGRINVYRPTSGVSGVMTLGLINSGNFGIDNVMALLSSGNVGIGTTTPGQTLDVETNGAWDRGIRINRVGYSGRDITYGIAGVDDGSLGFSKNGGASSGYDMVISGSGKVGIGTTNPLYKLDVIASGTGPIARFNSANSTGCDINTDGTIVCTSDRRLKKNITDSDYGLSDIMALRPVEYNWLYQSNKARKSIGFIAQEVEEILPQLVVTNPEGRKELNTIGLIPILTKGLQEEHREVTSIKGQITDMDESITTLNDQTLSTEDKIALIKTSLTATTEILKQVQKDSETLSLSLETLKTQMEDLKLQNQSIIDFAAALETDRLVYKDTLGNVNLLDGQLEAEGIVAGAFTIKIVDEEKKTIGEGKILKGESKAIIKTKAILESSQIFVNIKMKEENVFIPEEPLVTADIKPEESFEVRIKNPAEEDIYFSWWIVEMKEN